ncbi:hypothetical protein HMPREF0072_0559, partial [Anaerococcus lactolyticus ATCC 51172]
ESDTDDCGGDLSGLHVCLSEDVMVLDVWLSCSRIRALLAALPGVAGWSVI